MRLLLGVPAKENLEGALLLTYEWPDLTVCTPGEIQKSLPSILLRWSSYIPSTR